jgi:hypothetical protein
LGGKWCGVLKWIDWRSRLLATQQDSLTDNSNQLEDARSRGKGDRSRDGRRNWYRKVDLEGKKNSS